MGSDETDMQVLAIASHVTYGYVGNKMATFVMQTLGCDVSAIDTVHFSNHTAYKQFTGTKVPAKEIQQLYDGLKQSDLNHFDAMLSGYIASKEAVETVGAIARDLRATAADTSDSFFWALDPVMGDEGRLYVAEDIVPAYKALLPDADLILPNCFEAELLSDMEITDMKTLVQAVTKMHQVYRVPHIIVTSLRLSPRSGRRKSFSDADQLAVMGSSCTADYSPRIFSVRVPSLPVFFSGTGDMFAALALVRLREEVGAAPEKLQTAKSWRPRDDVVATELPLAKATVRTLASMHSILVKTARDRDHELEEEVIVDGPREEDDRRLHLRRTRASEIRVVKYAGDLVNPKIDDADGKGLCFKAEAVQVDVYRVDEAHER